MTRRFFMLCCATITGLGTRVATAFTQQRKALPIVIDGTTIPTPQLHDELFQPRKEMAVPKGYRRLKRYDENGLLVADVILGPLGLISLRIDVGKLKQLSPGKCDIWVAILPIGHNDSGWCELNDWSMSRHDQPAPGTFFSEDDRIDGRLSRPTKTA